VNVFDFVHRTARQQATLRQVWVYLCFYVRLFMFLILCTAAASYT